MTPLVDRLIAALLLLVLTPLLALIGVLIRLESPGPVLYIPPMVGHRGRLFPLLRFRTMAISGEQRGRWTRTGAVIRHLSLDHLPALLNILWGDLALSGPRPMEPARVDLRDPLWQQYVQLKPGLFNYAILTLGREWNASRVAHPTLNQRLELEHARRQTPGERWRLVGRSLRAWLASGGNIKARKPPEPDVLI